jgi:hypothetical protein
MKKVRLALLALGVTAFLSFCISTGSLDRAAVTTAAIDSPTVNMVNN